MRPGSAIYMCGDNPNFEIGIEVRLKLDLALLVLSTGDIYLLAHLDITIYKGRKEGRKAWTRHVHYTQLEIDPTNSETFQPR